MSNRGADYPEQCIRQLAPEYARQLAVMSLSGYCVTCGELTKVGNRWWNACLHGHSLHGIGGLRLESVVARMWRDYQYRQGVL